jgi:hypothetical protein
LERGAQVVEILDSGQELGKYKSLNQSCFQANRGLDGFGYEVAQLKD